MPQIISNSTATRSISNASFPSINERLTSGEPEDMEQDPSDKDSRPICDVESTSSMTATTNTHIPPRFSISSSSYRGIGGSSAVGSGADIGTGSLSPASLLHPSPSYATLSTSSRTRKQRPTTQRHFTAFPDNLWWGYQHWPAYHTEHIVSFPVVKRGLISGKCIYFLRCLIYVA